MPAGQFSQQQGTSASVGPGGPTGVDALGAALPGTTGTGVDREGEHRWAVRLWVLVAVFMAVGLVRSAQVGIPFRDPHGEILGTRIALSLGIFAGLVVVDGALRAGRGHLTPREVAGVVRRRWTRRRLLLTANALLAYHLVYFTYHNLKSWDVFRAPRDAVLLHADRVLFLGHSPAVLLHDILPERFATWPLMVVYESFATLMAVAFVAALVFAHRIRDGYVFIVSASVVWILGVGSYYLIPTLGPFWSAPSEFTGMPRTMIQDTQARYLAQRAHLLAHPHAHDAFAQVSAFASLHVAVSAMIFLMARYYGLRRLATALGVFLAATVVATVYLGWHFALDDVAGLLIAVIGVRAGRWMVYPGGERGRGTGSYLGGPPVVPVAGARE